VFLFGFAKSDRDNIGPQHTADLKDAARDVLAVSSEEIASRLAAQTLTEVPYGKKD